MEVEVRARESQGVGVVALTPTFILYDTANNPLYCVLIHVIVIS